MRGWLWSAGFYYRSCGSISEDGAVWSWRRRRWRSGGSLRKWVLAAWLLLVTICIGVCGYCYCCTACSESQMEKQKIILRAEPQMFREACVEIHMTVNLQIRNLEGLYLGTALQRSDRCTRDWRYCLASTGTSLVDRRKGRRAPFNHGPKVEFSVGTVRRRIGGD